MSYEPELPDEIAERHGGSAALADVAGQKFHDLSGAAVSAGEATRLKPYIPSASDSPATAKAKLQQRRKAIASASSRSSVACAKMIVPKTLLNSQ